MCLGLLLFVTAVFWYSIAAEIFIFIIVMFIVACIIQVLVWHCCKFVDGILVVQALEVNIISNWDCESESAQRLSLNLVQ